jgi:hypothetical protein
MKKKREWRFTKKRGYTKKPHKRKKRALCRGEGGFGPVESI